jgi:uncharacterized membrane protein
LSREGKPTRLNPSSKQEGPALPTGLIERMIGGVLLGGVLLSSALILAGLGWHCIRYHDLTFKYLISASTVFQFFSHDLSSFVSSPPRPRDLLNLGIAVLLLTPYVRVAISFFYFLLVERSWRFTLITGFVISVLTWGILRG